MKSSYLFLFIALIAYGNCFDFSIITCIITNENIQQQAINIFKAIKTKDIPTIISTVISAYFSIKDDVMNCLEPKPALRATAECQKPELYARCKEKCTGMLHMICKKDCYNCWCL